MTQKKAPTSVNALMRNKNRGVLQQLWQRANAVKTLNQQLQTLLPPDIAPHCHVANLEKGCLTLNVDSSSWAAKCRYQKGQLLSQLRQSPQFAGLISIRFKVQIPTNSKKRQKKSRQPKALGQEALTMLEGMITETNNAHLQQALQRFSKHQNRD